MRIPLLPLLLFPFLELWLMIVIGDEIGALPVILWLVAMIFVGVNLLRFLGAASMLKVAQDIRTGQLPAETIADGLFKAIGAVLLIIPGFITDFLALICFIPWFRRLLLKSWVAKMNVRAAGFTHQQSPFGRNPFDSGNGNVYDHEGPAKRGDSSHEGILIEQEKSSASDSSSLDSTTANDHKKP